MINPASKAMRRAEILFANLNIPRYADKTMRRYEFLVDALTSDTFIDYMRSLAKTIGMIPSSKMAKEEMHYLEGVPESVMNAAQNLAVSHLGTQRFSQGLAGLILNLRAALRAEEKVDRIYSSE